jgi:hypothetical protein
MTAFAITLSCVATVVLVGSVVYVVKARSDRDDWFAAFVHASQQWSQATKERDDYARELRTMIGKELTARHADSRRWSSN